MSPLLGYRPSHAPLLLGRWLAGELIAPKDDARVPAFADGIEVAAPDVCYDERLLVAPEHGILRFAEMDWVDRRARLEVRLLSEFSEKCVRTLLEQAVETACKVFGLNRVYGFITPGGPDVSELLSSSGFARELTVPNAVRVGGRAVGRDVWARLREG